MNLHGRRVLVTGATGGLGQAIADALHARGARLVLTGRRADVLDAVAARVGGETVVADLETVDGVAALAEAAGEVDVLVANAGLPASGPVLEYTPDQIDRALGVNLRAPMLLARAFAPQMVERGSGHVVFISSLSGKAASPGTAIYSATKFGMRGFALGLREDLIGTGVGVTTVFPGFIVGAGMLDDAGVRLPFFAGAKRPEHVGRAVVRAVEQEPAELGVAALPIRAGAALAGLAPRPVNAVQRRLGARGIADQMGSAQRDKR